MRPRKRRRHDLGSCSPGAGVQLFPARRSGVGRAERGVRRLTHSPAGLQIGTQPPFPAHSVLAEDSEGAFLGEGSKGPCLGLQQKAAGRWRGRGRVMVLSQSLCSPFAQRRTLSHSNVTDFKLNWGIYIHPVSNPDTTLACLLSPRECLSDLDYWSPPPQQAHP